MLRGSGCRDVGGPVGGERARPLQAGTPLNHHPRLWSALKNSFSLHTTVLQGSPILKLPCCSMPTLGCETKQTMNPSTVALSWPASTPKRHSSSFNATLLSTIAGG